MPPKLWPRFSSRICWRAPEFSHNYQPIVHLHEGTHIGYEILSRSQFVGLETPAKMFRVAAQRISEAELSRVCRVEGLRGAADLDRRYQLYLNTHPAELRSDELLESVRTLRSLYPDQELVLEVHESGVTSIEFLRNLRSALTDLNIGLAYDDFGAGQARSADARINDSCAPLKLNARRQSHDNI